MRSAAPTRFGVAVSQNSSPGVNSCPAPNPALLRLSTSTDHNTQIENPMCSAKTEKIRFLRATAFPVFCQNAGFSGSQSSIHLPRRGATTAGVSTIVILVINLPPTGQQKSDLKFREQ